MPWQRGSRARELLQSCPRLQVRAGGKSPKMFALPKLALLLLAIAAVWIGYRWLNGPPRELPQRRSGPRRPVIHAEDLAACGACGAYMAAGARGCGRADCPRPR